MLELAKTGDVTGAQELSDLDRKAAVNKAMDSVDWAFVATHTSHPIYFNREVFTLVDDDTTEVYERGDAIEGNDQGDRYIVTAVLRSNATGQLLTVVNMHQLPHIQKHGVLNKRQPKRIAMAVAAEALNAQLRDYSHDHGHDVLKVIRKGGKTARVALAPPVVRVLDTYLAGRTAGLVFLGRDDQGRYGYKVAQEQIARLCRSADLPAGVTPHSLRHSYATEALRTGAALQDVQDALGHADPRTTRRYDRSRHNLDRSPNYLLAAALTSAEQDQAPPPQTTR